VTTTNEFEEVKALFEQSHNLMLKMAEFQYDLKLSDRLKKIAVHNQTKSNITLAEKFVENTELQIQNLQLRLKQSEEKYEKIKSHNESEFHAKLKACTDERDRILKDIKSKDALRIKLAEDIGRMNSTLCSMIEEKNLKESLVNKLKIYELAVVAFSKKGIPSLIVESQLPIINKEISKILHGIVDFTVSLELDKESDSLEIYIDYFDSKRLIELGSGMEKMIASVAIFLSFYLLSSLPQTAKGGLSKLISIFAQEITRVGFAQMQDVYSGALDAVPSSKDILRLYCYKTARYTFALLAVQVRFLAGAQKERSAHFRKRFPLLCGYPAIPKSPCAKSGVELRCRKLLR
jgi:hypothetical protein